MNKKVSIAILIIVVILVIVGIVLWLKWSNPTNPTSVVSTSTAVSSTTIHISVDFLTGAQSLSSLSSSIYTNTSTGATVSFKNFIGLDHGAALDVYVKNKKVDQVTGRTLTVFGFSPDNRYFAFRTEQVMGCCDERFTIHVLDLTSDDDIAVTPPYKESDYKGPKDYPSESVYPYIEPYKWDGGAMDFRSYFVAADYNENENSFSYYRVSPEEIWGYNLTGGSSVLISTTP